MNLITRNSTIAIVVSSCDKGRFNYRFMIPLNSSIVPSSGLNDKILYVQPFIGVPQRTWRADLQIEMNLNEQRRCIATADQIGILHLMVYHKRLKVLFPFSSRTPAKQIVFFDRRNVVRSLGFSKFLLSLSALILLSLSNDNW